MKRTLFLLLAAAALSQPPKADVIYDRDRRVLGTITQRGGRFVALDRDGRVLGEYDSRRNATLDRDGRVLHYGNTLSALIACR
jgi:hypothetical protein